MANKEVKMFNQFDSYIENGKFIIVSTYRDEFGDRVIQENIVSPDRARQIAKDLQENIKLLEK